MKAFLSHWQLLQRPFEATWDTRFFFGSQQHLEALNRMLYLVSETSMNLGLLTGEIGCGKTLTRSVFQTGLDPRVFRTAMVENSGFPLNDLLEAILLQLDPFSLQDLAPTKFARCERLREVLKQIADDGRHTVLLLDEAQDMPAETLHEIRWLTNFNGNGRSMLTIILIGQPNLRPRVEMAPAINQRISLRFHLPPLNDEEVPAYLAHRMQAAGHPDGEVFTDEAAHVMFRTTRGTPREINRMAKLALEHAWLHGLLKVGMPSVDAVIHDLMLQRALPA